MFGRDWTIKFWEDIQFIYQEEVTIISWEKVKKKGILFQLYGQQYILSKMLRVVIWRFGVRNKKGQFILIEHNVLMKKEVFGFVHSNGSSSYFLHCL